MVIPNAEMLLRLGASVVFGAAIGYEREHAGRPAGLRTHLLVSLASATFMIVSTQFVYFQNYGKDDLVAVDTSRIAASVVAGVGFLGAGAIFRTGMSVQGLTTAASLWMAASIGLAAGGGMYLVGAVATTSALVCLSVLRRVEGKQWRLIMRRVVVVVDTDAEHIRAITDCLRRFGAPTADVDRDLNRENNHARLAVNMRFPSQDSLDKLFADLAELPGVRRIKVNRPG